MILGEVLTSCTSSLRSFLQYPDILVSFLLWYTLRLRSSFCVEDQIHPHNKVTGKFNSVVYVYRFLRRKREDERVWTE